MWVGVCVVLSLLLRLFLRFLFLRFSLLLLHLPSLHLFFLPLFLFLLRFFLLLPLLFLQQEGALPPVGEIVHKVVELCLRCSCLLFSFFCSENCRPQSSLESPHHVF